MFKKEQRSLDEQLIALRGRLLLMCQAAGDSVAMVRKSVENNDVALAHKVIKDDIIIDELEDEIDTMSLSILALNQPVARDLRFIIGALRIVIDLERIGDEAVLIAESVLFRLEEKRNGPIKILPESRHLFDEAQKAFAYASEALKTEKVTRPGGGDEDDKSNDAEAIVLHSILHKPEVYDQDDLSAALEEILMVRSLNRIWRRSDNIVEQVWFIERGESLKHRRPKG